MLVLLKTILSVHSTLYNLQFQKLYRLNMCVTSENVCVGAGKNTNYCCHQAFISVYMETKEPKR